MRLGVEVAGKSDIGCVRSNNEDNFGFDSRCGIYVVCDGMGGMAAGEVASKLGVDTILDYYRQGTEAGTLPAYGTQMENVSPRANALGSAIQLANAAIFEAAKRHAAHHGMGSTIVAVSVENGFFSIGHVGDSRIYLVRNGQIQQLTNDHSLVMEQVRRGLITLEEARKSEVQNIIIRALGSEETVRPDLDDMMALPGDTLLLCSDGLTRHVEDSELAEAVRSSPSLEATCDALIAKARERGGEDNITVLLVRFVPQSFFGRIFGGGSPKWQNSL